MKYTTKQRRLENEYKRSWTFQLSTKDKDIIEQYNSELTPLYLFFICGYDEECKVGEIAILTHKEYENIKHKSSVTINIKKPRDKHFNIHIGKAEKDTFQIPTNRIEKRLQILNSVLYTELSLLH